MGANAGRLPQTDGDAFSALSRGDLALPSCALPFAGCCKHGCLRRGPCSAPALVALRFGILSYWMNGYWSASIVAFAGALVLGAWPRIRRHLHVRDALLMSLGLVILADSRPYEGLIFSLPVAVVMIVWLLGKNRPAFIQSIPRVVVPIFLCLLIASIATGYYYYRVTGSPFRMTYQEEAHAYAAVPAFLWQTPQAAAQYHHEVMRDFYHEELKVFETNRTLVGYLSSLGERFISWWKFYLGPLLTVPLLALPCIVHQRERCVCHSSYALLWPRHWQSRLGIGPIISLP